MRDLLYHYTSEAGFAGIIGSGNLWATHVQFLNDWTEFREAFTETYVQILVDSFRAALPVDLDVNSQRVIDGMLSRRIPEILEILEGSKSPNDTFVCSFTSAMPEETGDPGDRLSQWRGYAHSTQGFSLGFDKALLKARVEINNAKAKATLLECIYDEPAKVAFFEEMGRTAVTRFEELRRGNVQPPSWFVTGRPGANEQYKNSMFYFLDALSRATARFFTTAARIKHAGFREECEWRVIFQAKKEALAPTAKSGKRVEIVKFREGQFGRTPYIEIPLGLTEPDTSPLRRVVVGPGPHKEDVKRSVELLLLNHGIEVQEPGKPKGLEVVTSLIPYRSG